MVIKGDTRSSDYSSSNVFCIQRLDTYLLVDTSEDRVSKDEGPQNRCGELQ